MCDNNTDNINNIDNNDISLPEYYLLIDETSSSYYRIPINNFETMFEKSSNNIDTYQFNERTKSQYEERCYYGGYSLDNYICEHELNHAKSDWKTGDETFKIKGVYYWHDNIYSD